MRIFLALFIVLSGLSSKAIDQDGTQTFVGSDAQLKAGEAQMGSSSNQGSGDKSIGSISGGGGGSTNDGAKKSAVSNALGAASNTALTAIIGLQAFIDSGTCSACATSCVPICAKATVEWVLVGIGIGQIGMNVQSMTKSQRTASDSQFSGFEGKDFKLDLPDGSTFSSDNMRAQLNDLTNKMNQAGYKFDKNAGTITDPKGNVTKLSDMAGGSSAQIAAATGLSQQGVAAALSEMDKARRAVAAKFDANKVKLSFSGGSGSGSSATTASLASSGAPNFGSLFSSPKPAQAKIAGLQKNIGGQPVGIAQDNIFNMVQRRYEEKRKTEFFAK